MQTRYLWVQQRVREGDLRLKKELGDTNVSDALTKPLDEKRMTNLLTMMGIEFRDGRTSLALASAVTNCFQHDQIVFSGCDLHSWRGRGIFQCLSSFGFQHENFGSTWRRAVVFWSAMVALYLELHEASDTTVNFEF